MSKKLLSHVDAAWWRMDEPTNLMMITGVMVFEGRLDHERLRTLIEKRMLSAWLRPLDWFLLPALPD